MRSRREPRHWQIVWIFGLFLFIAGCNGSADDWECAADAKSLCPDEVQRPRIVTCLRAHKTSLSDACTASLAAQLAERQREKYRQTLGSVCSEDIDKFCDEMSASPDREAIANCLDEHHSEIHPACANKVRIKIHLRVGRDFDVACKNDIDDHCGDLSRNASPLDVRACLHERRDKITDLCKDMIDGKILSKRDQQEADRKADLERYNAAMGIESPTSQEPEN